jgi:hypothetical protein
LSEEKRHMPIGMAEAGDDERKATSALDGFDIVIGTAYKRAPEGLHLLNSL